MQELIVIVSVAGVACFVFGFYCGYKSANAAFREYLRRLPSREPTKVVESPPPQESGTGTTTKLSIEGYVELIIAELRILLKDSDYAKSSRLEERIMTLVNIHEVWIRNAYNNGVIVAKNAANTLYQYDLNVQASNKSV